MTSLSLLWILVLPCVCYTILQTGTIMSRYILKSSLSLYSFSFSHLFLSLSLSLTNINMDMQVYLLTWTLFLMWHPSLKGGHEQFNIGNCALWRGCHKERIRFMHCGSEVRWTHVLLLPCLQMLQQRGSMLHVSSFKMLPSETKIYPPLITLQSHTFSWLLFILLSSLTYIFL